MAKSNWRKLHDQELDWTLFKIRAQIIQTIRTFFQSNDFLEVEAPLLTPYPTLDSNIHSIETTLCSNTGKKQSLYLHTSPEHSMKKLLAAGAERIFYLGKVFRDRELTRFHNPEFTMLEWYRTRATYEDIQKDTEQLVYYISQETFSKDHIDFQNDKIDLTPPWKRLTLNELFKHHLGIELDKNWDIAELRRVANTCNIHFEPDDAWDILFFRIFLEKIEPHLGFPRPTFVLDYPLQMGLMAKRKKDNPELVERVELYIGGMELANGYSELLDADEQRKRFEQEQFKKNADNDLHYPIDEELISALDMAIPPSSGIALGVDRLIMLFTNNTDIRDVLLFPVHQWL